MVYARFTHNIMCMYFWTANLAVGHQLSLGFFLPDSIILKGSPPVCISSVLITCFSSIVAYSAALYLEIDMVKVVNAVRFY